MTCALCRGSGNLFCQQDGRREWYRCVGCGGAGARVMYGPAGIAFSLSGGQRKVLASASRKFNVAS